VGGAACYRPKRDRDILAWVGQFQGWISNH
jgi:hypothetical protein